MKSALEAAVKTKQRPRDLGVRADDVPDALKTDERLCVKCTHYQLCAVYLAIVPLVGNWPIGKENAPIVAENLAKICTAYEPFTVRVVGEKPKEG